MSYVIFLFFVNYYFQESLYLKVILYVAKITRNTATEIFKRSKTGCDPYLMCLAQIILQYIDVTSKAHRLVTLYRPGNKALPRNMRYTAICTFICTPG